MRGKKHNSIIMKRLFLLLTIVSMSLGAVAQRSERVEYQESSARNLEPEHSMMLTPLIADIKVSPTKITYTETEAFKDYPVSKGIEKLMPDFKSIALSRAAKAHKADLLVGTIIDIITNDNGMLEITVSGYPASYVGFRNATLNDIELVRQAKSVTSGKDNLDVINNPHNTQIDIKK